MAYLFHKGKERTSKAKTIITKVFQQVLTQHHDGTSNSDVKIALYLFGSFGRSESVPNADIDLLLVPSRSSKAQDVDAFHNSMMLALNKSALMKPPLCVNEIELTPWNTLHLVEIYAQTCNVAYNSWLNTIFVCGDEEAKTEGDMLREQCCNDKIRIRQSIIFNLDNFDRKAKVVFHSDEGLELKHGIGGARYMLFFSWFARYLNEEEIVLEGCGVLAGLAALKRKSLLPQSQTNMDNIVERCARILLLKSQTAEESYLIRPDNSSYAQFEEDARIIHELIVSITNDLFAIAPTKSLVDRSNATTKPSEKWILFAKRLTQPYLEQNELLQLAEEAAAPGMNCLAKEVARHPSSSKAIWEKLACLEQEDRILPAYCNKFPG